MVALYFFSFGTKLLRVREVSQAKFCCFLPYLPVLFTFPFAYGCRRTPIRFRRNDAKRWRKMSHDGKFMNPIIILFPLCDTIKSHAKRLNRKRFRNFRKFSLVIKPSYWTRTFTLHYYALRQITWQQLITFNDERCLTTEITFEPCLCFLLWLKIINNAKSETPRVRHVSSAIQPR